MLLFLPRFGSYLQICSNMQLVSTISIKPEFNLLFFNPDAKVDSNPNVLSYYFSLISNKNALLVL